MGESRLVQIGFSSGSYSCVGDICDYSKMHDQKQYINIPEFSQIATVTKNYQGEWSQSVEEIPLQAKLTLIALYLLFGVGTVFSYKGLRNV